MLQETYARALRLTAFFGCTVALVGCGWQQPAKKRTATEEQFTIRTAPVIVDQLDAKQQPPVGGTSLLRPDANFNGEPPRETVPRNYALFSQEAIEFQGVADVHAQYIALSTYCGGMYNTSLPYIQQPEHVESGWSWSVLLPSDFLCRGETVVHVTPSTCNLDRNEQEPSGQRPPCPLQQKVLVESSVAPVHPGTIAIKTPLYGNSLPYSRDTIRFEGIAAGDVETIGIRSTCNSITEALPLLTLIRPLETGSEWTWNFDIPIVSTHGCTQGATLLLAPSTCTGQPDDSCPLALRYPLVSSDTVNDFAISDITLTSASAGIPDVRQAERIEVSGTAGASITQVDISNTCMYDSLNKRKKVFKQSDSNASSGKSWRWSFTIDEQNEWLCKGENSFFVEAIDIVGEIHRQSVMFNAQKGYLPPEKKAVHDQTSSYISHTYRRVADIASAEHQPVIATPKNPVYNEICIEKLESLNESELQQLGSFSRQLIPPTPLNEHVQFQVILNDKEDKKPNYPVVSFLSDDGSAVPAPFEGYECNNYFLVYFLRNDRVILQTKRHTGELQLQFLWDGKEWRSLSNMIPGNNVAKTIAANESVFVVQEDRGCCDEFLPSVAGKDWARYVFDIDTLKIVDVLFAS